jgi:hypothetical protein
MCKALPWLSSIETNRKTSPRLLFIAIGYAASYSTALPEGLFLVTPEQGERGYTNRERFAKSPVIQMYPITVTSRVEHE